MRRSDSIFSCGIDSLSIADRVGGGDVLGEVLAELLEVLGAGHEVRLAVQLDQHGDLAVVVDVVADDALLGLPPGTLLGLRRALGAQQLDGLVDVAVGLLERLLAIHHAGAGLSRSAATSLAVIVAVICRIPVRQKCTWSWKRRRQRAGGGGMLRWTCGAQSYASGVSDPPSAPAPPSRRPPSPGPLRRAAIASGLARRRRGRRRRFRSSSPAGSAPRSEL